MDVVRVAAFGLGVVLGPLSVSVANTITVDLNGTGDYTEIQAAIDAALDGDEVVARAISIRIPSSVAGVRPLTSTWTPPQPVAVSAG